MSTASSSKNITTARAAAASAGGGAGKSVPPKKKRRKLVVRTKGSKRKSGGGGSTSISQPNQKSVAKSGSHAPMKGKSRGSKEKRQTASASSSASKSISTSRGSRTSRGKGRGGRIRGRGRGRTTQIRRKAVSSVVEESEEATSVPPSSDTAAENVSEPMMIEDAALMVTVVPSDHSAVDEVAVPKDEGDSGNMEDLRRKALAAMKTRIQGKKATLEEKEGVRVRQKASDDRSELNEHSSIVESNAKAHKSDIMSRPQLKPKSGNLKRHSTRTLAKMMGGKRIWQMNEKEVRKVNASVVVRQLNLELDQLVSEEPELQNLSQFEEGSSPTIVVTDEQLVELVRFTQDCWSELSEQGKSTEILIQPSDLGLE